MLGRLIRLPGWLRRWGFGRWELIDPRPMIAEAPYTFHVPDAAMIAALEPGDHVKLNFRSIPASPHWDGERMWVTLTGTADPDYTGILESRPNDMPQLRKGREIHFKRHHILSVIGGSEEKDQRLSEMGGREYWERCIVDADVLSGDAPIRCLYRFEPEPPEADEAFGFGGWVVLASPEPVEEAALEARAVSYVALGAVLNRDDSWLELIDRPAGSAFTRAGPGARFTPLAWDPA